VHIKHGLHARWLPRGNPRGDSRVIASRTTRNEEERRSVIRWRSTQIENDVGRCVELSCARPKKRKAPGFLHTLRMVERAYSQGADVRRMMAIDIIDVNSNNSWMCELDSIIYGAFARLYRRGDCRAEADANLTQVPVMRLARVKCGIIAACDASRRCAVLTPAQSSTQTRKSMLAPELSLDSRGLVS
jgi:hypothetical protein